MLVERPVPDELSSACTLSGGVHVHDVHPQVAIDRRLKRGPKRQAL